MEKGIYVKDIPDNAQISGIFAVSASRRQETKNGKPYWSLTLADNSGAIDAKMWHPLSECYESIETGILAQIRGYASKYKDTLQITLERFELLSASESAGVDARDFIPASPHDPEEMFAELKRLCLEEFRYPPWRKLILSVLNDPDICQALLVLPAAKKMHQAYAGGLLEHTLGVFKLCRLICDNYPELDRQVLLAGAFFHDFGKIREFTGGISNDYTEEGMLVGHILLGLEMLAPYLAKSGLDAGLRDHLKHLVASHHGEYEFGSPKLPQTAEAFALHYADNLDARLAQCRVLFEENSGPCWSAFQKSLDRSIFRPERTPAAKSARQSKREEQCLPLLKE